MTPVKVCLVTTAQPSTNPRLVKEADALVAAGYRVHVVAAHMTDWATSMDCVSASARRWRMTFVDWRRSKSRLLFHRSRARHWAARQAIKYPAIAHWCDSAALSRVGPELQKAAIRVPADLYIAHNLGALPAASAAAVAHAAKLGFDAEDFHSGQLGGLAQARTAAFTRAVERRYIPRAAYVTAASPGIAEAYRDMCGIKLPTCILNVFPLRARPSHFRADDGQEPVRLYWFSQTIGPDRGLEDVVCAMGLIGSPALELHIRGRWQPGYESLLRRLAVQAGVVQDKIVSHEPAHPDDMVRLASGYDVGLALEPCASVNNDIAISNKTFTYLLAGNALLSTRTSGQARLTNDLQGAAAWCEAGEPDSLAAALLPWLRQREALVMARQAAWDLGSRRFNWDRESHKFIRIVNEVLGWQT